MDSKIRADPTDVTNRIWNKAFPGKYASAADSQSQPELMMIIPGYL